jgi:hypothetical protein
MYTKKRNSKNYDSNLLALPDDCFEKLVPKNKSNRSVCYGSSGKIAYRIVPPDNPNWSIIDTLLGRVSDSKIAFFFGIPQISIYNRREKLGILPFEYVDWSIIDPLLSKGNDEEISDLFDKTVTIEAIRKRRKDLNIYLVDDVTDTSEN